MKAVLSTGYGGVEVLKYTEVKKPIPKDDEVLIKIVCASVSSGDAKMRSLNIHPAIKPIFRLVIGFKKPRAGILGSQFAGVVEAAGKAVTKFNAGDEVYGITGMKLGCYAQYVSLKENAVIAKKPSNITFEEAVPVPFGAMTALHILRNGKISKGDKVLIYGASGSVGTYAVQIAKHMGADVDAMCSPKNFDLMKELGAENAYDYHDYVFDGAEKYDVIFDTVAKMSKGKCKQSLKEKGRYLSVMQTTTETIEKLMYLNEMIENNEIKTVIDKTYSLQEIGKAHSYVDTGRKTGNVIIKVGH